MGFFFEGRRELGTASGTITAGFARTNAAPFE
jgi:hypothetical protein